MLKRSYTISCEEDLNHIKNNRCPDYALVWDPKFNKQYWEEDHDYFIGNNNFTEKTDTKYNKIVRKVLSNINK
jgi:hypothetical protein